MGFVLLMVVMILSVLVGIMVSNWIMLILLMELGLFFFIFMCLEYSSLSYSRSSIKYFFPQSIGSLLLLLGGLMLFMLQSVYTSLFHIIFLLGLLLKLGMFPMLFWVIPVSLELPYMMIGVMGCPLKIIPLLAYSNYYMLFNGPMVNYTMNIISLMTMMFGVWLGLFLKTMRGILGASSISHTGWFILGVHSSSVVSYFSLYSVGLILVLYFLINQDLFLASVNMLALAGLPPFSVFVGKMIIVYSSIRCNMSETFLVLVLLLSAVSLYYYLKFSFNMYLYSQTRNNLNMVICFSFLVNCGCATLFCLVFFYGRVGNSFLICVRD